MTSGYLPAPVDGSTKIASASNRPIGTISHSAPISESGVNGIRCSGPVAGSAGDLSRAAHRLRFGSTLAMNASVLLKSRCHAVSERAA